MIESWVGGKSGLAEDRAHIMRVGRWRYAVEPQTMGLHSGAWLIPWQGHTYVGRRRAERAARKIVRELERRRVLFLLRAGEPGA